MVNIAVADSVESGRMPGKQASKDVRREQIPRAAFEVASLEGIGSLTIRAVAAEASPGHFDTDEDV
jgi:DNA-binding transcriptional regulator YbjK